jgi:hypothetical protein
MEKLNLKNLKEVESKEQYHFEIPNSFAAVGINRVWETITESNKISAKVGLGYYELKKNKPRFDEG